MEGAVPLMLTYLYPHTSTLESAVQRLTTASCPFIFPTDPPFYHDTCSKTLVACDSTGQLEELACVCGSLRGCETRQRTVERNNSSLMLKSILKAVKNVCMCQGHDLYTVEARHIGNSGFNYIKREEVKVYSVHAIQY